MADIKTRGGIPLTEEEKEEHRRAFEEMEELSKAMEKQNEKRNKRSN